MRMNDELKIEAKALFVKTYVLYKLRQNQCRTQEMTEEDHPANLEHLDFGWVAFSYSTFLKSNVAFVPPNPKEFVSAIFTLAFLGELAT